MTTHFVACQPKESACSRPIRKPPLPLRKSSKEIKLGDNRPCAKSRLAEGYVERDYPAALGGSLRKLVPGPFTIGAERTSPSGRIVDKRAASKYTSLHEAGSPVAS